MSVVLIAAILVVIFAQVTALDVVALSIVSVINMASERGWNACLCSFGAWGRPAVVVV